MPAGSFTTDEPEAVRSPLRRRCRIADPPSFNRRLADEPLSDRFRAGWPAAARPRRGCASGSAAGRSVIGHAIQGWPPAVEREYAPPDVIEK